MNDTRIEQMLEENYKEISGKVEPSDYLKCALGYGCGLLVILSAVVIVFSG